jgi:ABC-type glycerol-3-phosphate transport system permease component
MSRIFRLFVFASCGAALAPVIWHVLTSLKTPSELAAIPPTLLPHDATLMNYLDLFHRRPFLRYYINSFTIAGMSSLICIATASLAAHSLARMRGQLRSAIRSGLLAIAFFPTIMLLFPLYELARVAGLVNHPWGLILPYSAQNLPFAIWLLTSSFEQIPFELEEAAAIDGLSRFQSYRLIVLPLASPALVSAGILVFIFAWNEFMLALTFMNIETQKTVTVGVATLSGAFTYEIPLGNIAAGVVVSALPLIILLIIFQRKIIAGLTAGALK